MVYEEILQEEKGSGQLGGWQVSGVGTSEKIRVQHSAETLGSLAATPGCFILCFKFLGIISSFFHYSEFWFINHKNESLN